MSEKSAKPILYIQTAFLGDLCLAVPTLKRIRLLRPQSPIFLVCREGVGSFLKKLQIVDEVYEVKKNNRDSYKAVAKSLASLKFEWILCPHQSWTSAWFQRALQAEKKISFSQWWNFLFFSERVVKLMVLPEALRQMSLLSVVDPDLKNLLLNYQNESINSSSAEGLLSRVPEWASAAVHAASLRTLASPRALRVVMFPGSTWETKKWQESGFVEVAQSFERRGWQVVIMGAANEFALCERIKLQTREGQNLAGKTNLFETLEVLSGAGIVICNDSGGQHLASLVDAPTVSLFGPTVLSQGFRPWTSKAVVAEVRDLGCRPCGRHGHDRCPIGTHECMKRLTSDQVLLAAEQLIRSQQSPSR